jgi:sodium ion-translocating decarboxylase beta subunit
LSSRQEPEGEVVWETFEIYLHSSGFGQMTLGNGIMLAVGLFFIFLAIRKGFEPLLLIPIGFGILIGNIPYDSKNLNLGVYDGPVPERDLTYIRVVYGAGQGAKRELTVAEPITSRLDGQALVEAGEAIMVNSHVKLVYPRKVEGPAIIDVGQGRRIFAASQAADHRYPIVVDPEDQDPWNASVLWFLFRGVDWGFFPPLIFLGIGALTDFGPLLANPRTILLGAAAQFGIFGTLLAALAMGFTPREAASIGIIGGADGPTAIFLSTKLAPDLLGAVALAAYSYMAMVPLIQPPIMRLLTTRKERRIRMEAPKEVSRHVRILFPVAAFLLTAFIANAALPLLGMLFFGNLLRESLVTDRLARTAQTAFIDIVTILLGVTVGAKTQAQNFLTWQTISIFLLGIVAFSVATAAGVIFGKIMNRFSRIPVNPLIGAAGVSAVPMSARVVHSLGQKEDPQNYLLMHAMGPNVAGVVGSAVAAGVLLSRLSG